MELTNDFRVSAAPPKAWEVLTDVERIAPMLPGAQLQEIEGDDFRGIVKVKVGPITAQYKGTATFDERNEADGRVVLRASGRDTRGQGNASATITATLVPDGDGTKVTVVTDLTVTGKVAQFGRGVLADVSSKLIGQFVDALEADLERSDAPVAPVPDAGAVVPDMIVPGSSQGAAVTADGTEPGAPAPADVSATEAAAAGAVQSGAVSAASVEGAPATGAATSSPDTGAAGRDNGSTSPEPAAASKPTVRRIDQPEPEPVDLLDAAGGSVAKRLGPIVGGIAVLVLLLLIGRSRRNR